MCGISNTILVEESLSLHVLRIHNGVLCAVLLNDTFADGYPQFRDVGLSALQGT